MPSTTPTAETPLDVVSQFEGIYKQRVSRESILQAAVGRSQFSDRRSKISLKNLCGVLAGSLHEENGSPK